MRIVCLSTKAFGTASGSREWESLRILRTEAVVHEFACWVRVRPHRLLHAQHVCKAKVALLLFSTSISFSFDDYEGQVPFRDYKRGLKAMASAAFIAAANVGFTICVAYLICNVYLRKFFAYLLDNYKFQARPSRHAAPVLEVASTRVLGRDMGT